MGKKTKTEHTEDKNSQKRSQNRKEHGGIIQILIKLEGGLGAFDASSFVEVMEACDYA